MRVLHLSTGDNRGAYSAAYRIHRHFLQCGHESLMWVAEKTVNDTTVIEPTRIRYVLWRSLKTIMAVYRRVIFSSESRKKYSPTFDISLLSLKNYIRNSNNFQADLLIVYSVSDFISLKDIAYLALKWRAKLAFYHMDMGLMTGSCHYAWQCKQYQQIDACSDCVMQTRISLSKNLIRNNWLNKAQALTVFKPTVICGSDQLLKQSSSSTLLSNCAHHTILMAVDPERYRPINAVDKASARIKLGLRPEAKVIYFGAQSLDDTRKGFVYLEEALLNLSLSELSDKDGFLTVLIVGRCKRPIRKNPFIEYVCHNYIGDVDTYARIYALADVMVCASIEDSGPMMINESMMSGLPVIAFSSGVAPDLVNEKTGWLVESVSPAGIKGAILEFLNNDEAKNVNMRINCRELALNKCSPEAQVANLYKIFN